MSKFWVLVGSFSPFITTLQFTPNPPSLSLVSQLSVAGSPSWLANSPKFPTTIYATNETDTGSINSFTLDLISGNLTKVANVPTQGAAPTHLGFVNNGTALGAANFVNGSAFIVDLDATGSGQFKGGDSLVPFQGSGPSPSQTGPHAHQVVPFGKEVLVPDLGSDKIWRLTEDGNNKWSIKGSIDQPAGSGPRHIVVVDNSVYTVHELANTVTQHTITPLSANTPSPLVANVSILPSDLPPNAKMGAAELLYASSPAPLLYASNRNVAPNAIADDTIAVLSTTPQLKVLGFVKTGLGQIRAMAFMGENDEYILAAGLVGGGIKVYERVSQQQGFLKEVAKLPETTVTSPTSFVAIDQSGKPSTTGVGPVATPPNSVSSKAHKRFRRVFLS